jgi:hypothetical protein
MKMKKNEKPRKNGWILKYHNSLFQEKKRKKKNGYWAPELDPNPIY